MNNKTPYIDKIIAKGLFSYTASLSQMWLIILFSFIQNIISVSLPFIFIFIITHLWFVENPFTYIQICFGFVIVGVTWSFCSFIKDKLFNNILLEHNYNISIEAIRLLINLPYTSLGNLPIESQFSRFTPLENLGHQWFYQTVKPLLDVPLVILAFSVLCMYLGFVFFSFLILILITVLMLKKYRPNIHADLVTEPEYQGTLKDTFANLNLIRSHSRTGFFYDKTQKIIENKFRQSFASSVRKSIVDNINESVLMLLYVVALVLGVYYTFTGEVQIPSLIAIIILTWFIINPMKSLINVSGEINKSQDLVGKFQNLIKITRVTNRHKKIELDNSFLGNISLKNVNVTYGGTSKFVMQNLNFNTKRNEILFLYGVSGSGKSTLMKLIAGLIKPAAGIITIDMDINSIDEESLKSKIIYISHDAYFDNFSIEDNLDMSPNKLSHQNLTNIASKLHINSTSSSLVTEYPLREFNIANSDKISYDNIVNQIILSKIDPNITGKIILLDEPLRSPDTDTLAMLSNLINQVKHNNTVIIASRYDVYATVADNIILLNNGKIENIWTKK